MILPSDPLAIPQPGFRSDPVSDSSTWEYGKLENTYSVEHLVDLKMACPEELKQVVIDDFKDITFIEACKIYSLDEKN